MLFRSVAIFDLACKGERAGHTIDAFEGAVARGNGRGVGTRFELGIEIATFGYVMTRWKRQFVQLFEHRPIGIVFHLAIVQIGNAGYAT